MPFSTTCTRRLCVCASEHIKIIETLEGRFPDFGHHLENEMGGVWLHPVKLLDGFWMHFRDYSDTADCWIAADSYTALPHGNIFHYRHGLGHTPVQIDLYQLAPEAATGAILNYRLINKGSARRIGLRFLARSDLRPVWNGEVSGMYDAFDEIRWLPELNAFHAKDSGSEWHVMFGSSEAPKDTQQGDLSGPEITRGQGTSGQMMFEMELAAHEKRTLTFYIAGSRSSYADCAAQYAWLGSGVDHEAEKKSRMDAIFHRSCLVTDDTDFCDKYAWVKYNTDWLIQRTPYGRALSAGLPEYAWWFGCDSCYAVQGLLCMGETELCRDTLELILNASRQAAGDGRIVHEITTEGSVYHTGNTQETAHYVVALWQYYQWTGDIDFVKLAMPYLKLSVRWLEAQDHDGDLFPSGYGITEIAGLNLELIDTAVYTAEAYGIYAHLCTMLQIDDNAAKYAELSQRLRHEINTKMWDDAEGLYCDAYASGKEVLSKLEEIIEHVPEEKIDAAREMIKAAAREKPYEGESGWLLNKNWVINIPMEMGLAEPDQAKRALARMHTSEFIGQYGMYLAALHQKEMMTITTGVMAVAQLRYGYADRALELLQTMFKTFGMCTPGSLSEMSPDYGCFVQAWTAYAVLVPVVTGFYGVKPSAATGETLIKPCMPTAWNRSALYNIRVPGGFISLEFERNGTSETWVVCNNTDKPVRFFGDSEILLDTGRHEVNVLHSGNSSAESPSSFINTRNGERIEN